MINGIKLNVECVYLLYNMTASCCQLTVLMSISTIDGHILWVSFLPTPHGFAGVGVAAVAAVAPVGFVVNG